MSIPVMALLGSIFCLAVALAMVNLVQARRMRRRPNGAERGPTVHEHHAPPKSRSGP